MHYKMTWHVVFLIFCSVTLVKAQPIKHPGKSQNRIFFSSADIYDSTDDASISSIRESWGRLGKNLMVIDQNGKKTKYKRSEIWGYQRKEDKCIKRIFEKDTYIIKEISDVVIYKYYVKHGTYFFSIDIDSPVIKLNKKELVKIIGNERFFKLYKKSLILRQIID